jgi:hypothetical protein
MQALDCRSVSWFKYRPVGAITLKNREWCDYGRKAAKTLGSAGQYSWDSGMFAGIGSQGTAGAGEAPLRPEGSSTSSPTSSAKSVVTRARR